MIEAIDIGKRFDNKWIFRHLNLQIHADSKLAILGSNGSGKSTLLRILSGKMLPTEGEILYKHDGNSIHTNNFHRYITFAAPYLDLPEEMTTPEILSFHTVFKPLLNQISTDDFIRIALLSDHKSKQIHTFSSGMKQRLKLALALLTQSSLVMLDEPCTNLDQKGREWYKELIENYTANRCVIVCSNHDKTEIFFCSSQINTDTFKK